MNYDNDITTIVVDIKKQKENTTVHELCRRIRRPGSLAGSGKVDVRFPGLMKCGILQARLRYQQGDDLYGFDLVQRVVINFADSFATVHSEIF